MTRVSPATAAQRLPPGHARSPISTKAAARELIAISKSPIVQWNTANACSRSVPAVQIVYSGRCAASHNRFSEAVTRRYPRNPLIQSVETLTVLRPAVARWRRKLDRGQYPSPPFEDHFTLGHNRPGFALSRSLDVA